MRKIGFILFLLFISSVVIHASIPLSGKLDSKKETIEKQSMVKNTSVLKRLFAQNLPREDRSTFNTLSLILSFLFAPAGLVLGIIGLSRKEKYKGLGIAGIIMSILFILITILMAPLFSFLLEVLIAIFSL